jgi:hypothetical protein
MNVLRESDRLLVVWIDGAEVGDEPLIVFKTICSFLVLNFKLYFHQRHRRKEAPLNVNGATLLQNASEGIGNFWLAVPLIHQRVLVTTWGFCHLGHWRHFCKRVAQLT